MNAVKNKERMRGNTKQEKKDRRVWIILSPLIIGLLYLASRPIYIRSALTVQVVEKETGNPVPYALVRYIGHPYGSDGCYQSIGSVWYHVATTDKEGKVSFPLKVGILSILPFMGSFSDGCFDLFAGIVQELEIWFPGYKKFVAYGGGKPGLLFHSSNPDHMLFKALTTKEGQKRLKGYMAISLERPKTAEEAVGAIRDGLDDYPTLKQAMGDDVQAALNLERLYVEARMKEKTRIIMSYPKTLWADEAFKYGDWQKNIGHITCDNFLDKENQKRCIELKEKYE